MIKGFAEEHKINPPGKVTGSALSDEQKMILTEGASSLYVRDVFSKLTSQFLNEAWDYQKNHITKL